MPDIWGIHLAKSEEQNWLHKIIELAHTFNRTVINVDLHRFGIICVVISMWILQKDKSNNVNDILKLKYVETCTSENVNHNIWWNKFSRNKIWGTAK